MTDRASLDLLGVETADWERLTTAIGRVLKQ
jgi:hypothetical protein